MLVAELREGDAARDAVRIGARVAAPALPGALRGNGLGTEAAVLPLSLEKTLGDERLFHRQHVGSVDRCALRRLGVAAGGRDNVGQVYAWPRRDGDDGYSGGRVVVRRAKAART